MTALGLRAYQPTAESVIALMEQTFATLGRQHDFSPNNTLINMTLSAFVAEIMAADHAIADKSAILTHDTVRVLRRPLLQILSVAEYEMEMYFSRLLTREPELGLRDLNKFWYRQNYESLIRQESEGIRTLVRDRNVMNDDRPIVFVGAGPLPLSAIDYYLQLGKKSICVEFDHEAAMAGRALIERLGLTPYITYVNAAGEDYQYRNSSLVMLASLVENKDLVLEQVRRTGPDSIVGIRSAEGLKTLLYEPISIADVVAQGFKYYGSTRANDETVNCACFFHAA